MTKIILWLAVLLITSFVLGGCSSTKRIIFINSRRADYFVSIPELNCSVTVLAGKRLDSGCRTAGGPMTLVITSVKDDTKWTKFYSQPEVKQNLIKGKYVIVSI